MGRRWWVGVAALACVVAGCGGGDGGDPGGESTPSVTVSESPTAPSTTGAAGAVAPTLPPEAAGEDAAAAEAFVEHMWAVVKYAESTGDVEALRVLMSPQCVGCGGAIRFLRGVFKKDGKISGGDVALSNFETTTLGGGPVTMFQVDVDVKSTRQTVSYPGSTDDEVYPAGTVRGRFFALKDSGRWVIDRWEVL